MRTARFIITAWRQVWAPLALLTVAGAGLRLAGAGTSGAGSVGLWLVLVASAALVAYAALYRLALKPQAVKGFPLLGGLRLGADEGRLLAVSLLLLAVAGLAMLGVLFLILLGVAVLGQLGIDAEAVRDFGDLGPTGGAVVVLLAAPSLLGLAYLAARLALAPAATAAQGRVSVFSSLPLSRGRALKLFAALAAGAAPGVAAALAAPYAPVLAGALISALVQALISAPLTAGLLSQIYIEANLKPAKGEPRS